MIILTKHMDLAGTIYGTGPLPMMNFGGDDHEMMMYFMWTIGVLYVVNK